MAEAKKKTYWTALESNPDTMNKLIKDIGVKGLRCEDIYGFDDDALAFIPQPCYAVILCFPEYKKLIKDIGVKGLRCEDIYGFDDDALAFIPQPCYAVILCFPEYKKALEYVKRSYEELKAKNYKNPEKVFFMNQKIGNACGTFSLLHSIANVRDKVNIGNGPFAQWIKKALPLGVNERSECLEKDEQMHKAHESSAQSGDTDASRVDHAFITYVNIDGTLYEIDSSMDFARPIGNGPFTQWIEKALPLGVDERSECLEKDEQMHKAHESSAQSGDTDASRVDHAFITYVNIDGTLYEIDSSMDFARPVGPSTPETMLHDAAKVIKDFIVKFESESISFNAMALVSEE
uniref:Ubiquitin carboxyl-terminal hydrolase n=1 Tax=Panagrolaimus sp. ES5 TaxID=591445 RepID=A0AC34FGK3_9BILA